MSNQIINLRRWKAIKINADSSKIPAHKKIGDLTEREIEAADLDLSRTYRHQLAFDGLAMGRRHRARTLGDFRPHPFLNSVQVSNRGGVRYHGAPTGFNVAEISHSRVEFMRLSRPKPPELIEELAGQENGCLKILQRVPLLLPTIPLAVLVHETHDSDCPPRPIQGGEYQPNRPIKEIGQRLSEAVERPLETPEDWDLETRLACWAIALRGRAWNHWIERFDIGSTDKATRGHARDD